MSAIPSTITPAAAQKPEKQIVQRVVADALKPRQRQQISHFLTVLDFMLALPTPKAAKGHKIAEFQQLFSAGKLPDNVRAALAELRGKKAELCPDVATFYRWLEDYEHFKTGNAVALIKQYKGRPRKAHGWEQKAVELFNSPTKPGYADVAFWLRTDYGFESATATRVERYLKKLPETLGKKSPQRMGKQYYKHNLSPYKIRDNEVLPVGYGYEGDGHTVDVYVAHPNTGGLYRPELTVWIDVRSRFVVGWYLCDNESSINTLFAISEAIISHDHVPAVLYLDNGSGFASRMMTDDVTGFFSRLSITTSFSLPGNSKGKGLVEGFFKIFRNRHDKKPAFNGCYCGDDMAPEITRRLSDLVKQGKRTLPSLAQYTESVRKYIIDYNNEPKAVLEGKCPSEIWRQDLLHVHVHIHADALIWPRALRTVTRWRIRHDNRFYDAAELAHYNGREVLIEYSLHHDGEIRVLDEHERLICIAKLVRKIARESESRLEERAQKREQGKVTRKINQIEEIRARSKPAIASDADANAIIEISDFSRLNQSAELDINPEDALFLGHEDKAAADYLTIGDDFLER